MDRWMIRVLGSRLEITEKIEMSSSKLTLLVQWQLKK